MAKKIEISYNNAIAEIEEIIEQIENQELDVDNLSEKIKRVSILLKICKDELFETEKEVENILKNINE